MFNEPSVTDDILCKVLPYSEVVGDRRLDMLEVFSKNPAYSMDEPAIGNSLCFQYSYWGRAFFYPDDVEFSGWSDPNYLYECRNVSVIAPDGAVVFDRSGVLQRHAHFLPGGFVETRFRRPPAGDHLLLRREEEQTLNGTYALGFTPVSPNYAHWMTESLPLWVFYADRLKPVGVKLLLGPLTGFHRETLALLGIGSDDVIELGPGQFRVERLYLTSPMDLGAPASVMRAVGERLAQQAGGYAPEAERRCIFVSRSDASTRRLLNEVQIMQRLSRFGFDAVRCTDLSVAEQIKLMSSASALVGAHGAALSNMIFCPPGTKVLELFPEFCLNAHFRRVADRMSFGYGFLQGTSFENEDSRSENPAARMRAWNQDFVIDPELVERAAGWLTA